MKIPVTGFVMESNDFGSQHSHTLFITTWDGRPVHRHAFSGCTSCDDGHTHYYAGMTEPAPTGVPHVHHYYTVTAISHGHTHTIKGTTGPAIPLPNGGHVHYFEGYTTVDGMNPHSHMYRGTTGDVG
ncbi:YmaF family protein [Brevibacillus dissolubilis]|uniref:YmaF family protein n=1 Tax=Brevibacillus dissolubilis TaxID=1844116 RepID=UPI0011165AC5|nr:YmaF family protein [Brevibacillus dissolubilis]